MALSNQGKILLNDIFSASLKSPKGINAPRFRADNEQFMPELDQLERLGYLPRSNDLYTINPLVLSYLAKENPDAQSLVQKCSLVFALLQGNYRDNLGEQITVLDIAKRTGLSDYDARAALQIIIQTSIVGSHSANLMKENATVAPSEKILKYKSFEDILNELQERAEESNKHSHETVKLDSNHPENPIEQANGIPIQFFDAMQFHPKVVEVSKDCFIAGNYREAILNAFICLIDYVKERTGLDLDGDALMNQVFSINYDKEQRRITKYPIIRINELQNMSDRDEQQGFMFLYKGAVGGIRNPKAHKLIPQSNPLHTLEYLAFSSLLMRRIEEGKIVRTSQSRRKWDWDIFIKDTKEKCEQKIIDLTKNLYDFTSANSDSISWGTGKEDGSFTFRKLSINGEISIFSVYSYGWVYINFGSMINKTVPDSIIETFRTSLNSIPNINIPRSAITDGKYVRIYENPITNFNNLQIFKDAVISLCQQLENN